MSAVTPAAVKAFLVQRHAEQLRTVGVDPANVPDTFDFLISGAIDSFGVLEMIAAVEQQFSVQLDIASLDAEKLTVLGPLAEHVAQSAAGKG